MGLLHPSWWSVLWRKFLGGVLGISMGLMLGREGPSIQLGAMTAKRQRRTSLREKRVLIAAGAAGLSAAFNAPIAGLLFVVEEVYHHFSRHVWVTALTASFSSQCCFLRIFIEVPVLCYDRKITRISFERLLDSYCFWGIFLGVLWIRL